MRIDLHVHDERCAAKIDALSGMIRDLVTLVLKQGAMNMSQLDQLRAEIQATGPLLAALSEKVSAAISKIESGIPVTPGGELLPDLTAEIQQLREANGAIEQIAQSISAVVSPEAPPAEG